MYKYQSSSTQRAYSNTAKRFTLALINSSLFSYCLDACCMFLPSALCRFLFCLSSFPVSLSVHVKPLHYLHFGSFFISLFINFFLFCLPPTKCHSYGLYLFYCCWSEYSIYVFLQYWGVCGTKWGIPSKSGCVQGILLNLYLRLGSVAEAHFLSCGVLSNTVCFMKVVWPITVLLLAEQSCPELTPDPKPTR